MSRTGILRILGLFACLALLADSSTRAQQVQTVFVIAMENHNWTQPAGQFSGKIQQVYQNPSAPLANSLVNGTATNISNQVSFAMAYHNVLATPSGNNPSIHPSEPNYIWAEAGTNFGILNDDDPYAHTPPNSQNTSMHLSNLLTQAGKTWRAYQEDIDLTASGNSFCNTPLPQARWTVPLSSISGAFTCGPANAYNQSNQYDYAAKHNPMVFFNDTNGGDDSTPANPLSTHYAPLQQLATDLANGTVASSNWISPNQFNDMHTALQHGFNGQKGDAANIMQGDYFLSQVVPMIMASSAYKNNGVIILWWDETESGGKGDNGDDFNHTLGEIIISPLAHPNVNGLPYSNTVDYSHSSDLRTMQEIFQVGTSFLGDAANANDLSDLFIAGAIPSTLP